MLYFIPAWYQKNTWCENEQIWYVRRMHTEFDDTVKQIQLFHRSRAFPYQIMLLSFAPNFRHFLHRQSVFHASYWSCFDAIQGVRRKQPVVLSFHNLKWPANIEFVYTPFVVTALLCGEKYAQIEFGEDGNPIQIDLYQNGKISRRNIYDDRGFVSATILYQDEKPLYQDYLMENGAWKIRRFFQDGHVEVNPKHPEYLLVSQEKEEVRKFSRLSYDSLDQVIFETLASYLKLADEKDIFCVAMHDRHTTVLKEALKGRKTILSFFSDRCMIGKNQKAMEMIKRADYMIADSGENLEKLRTAGNASAKHMTSITPYDSRTDFGISRQLDVQKIMVPVDGMEEEDFQELIRLLGAYVTEHNAVQVHLFTRKAELDRKRNLLSRTRKYLEQAGFHKGMAEEETKRHAAENNLDESLVPVRFFVEQCVDELAVSKCMREQRVMADVRKAPELYLQIASISIGIPQIVRKKTEFVEHGKNGVVLKDMKKLGEALSHYLDTMANWNEAMVYAYELGKKYTTERLMEKWKEVIRFVG